MIDGTRTQEFNWLKQQVPHRVDLRTRRSP